jgi:hypothetical protein
MSGLRQLDRWLISAGAWWVADATQSGFTIDWGNQALPASASVAPQIIWSAKFAG